MGLDDQSEACADWGAACLALLTDQKTDPAWQYVVVVIPAIQLKRMGKAARYVAVA
jgi:hypothetical protein